MRPQPLLLPALLTCLLGGAAAGAAAPGKALLWLPDGAAGAGDIIALLEADKALRLTAAFGDLPADLDARVRKLEAEGRLETALRPAGDPPLPLLYYPALDSVKWEGKPSTSSLAGGSQFFLGLRFGLLRESAQRRGRAVPPGAVFPPGGLVPDYFTLARALGTKWLACGPLASTAAAVLNAEGVAAVPFAPVDPSSPSAAAGGFLLYDETAPAGQAAVRAALAAELRRQPKEPLLTVSEALKTAASTAAAPAEAAALAAPWRSGAWSQDYSRWAAAPLQAGALAALAKTRSELAAHLNAAGGDLNAARAPFEEYFSAEDGARLAALAAPDADAARETETGLRATLANVFRLMGKAPPPWVYSSLAEAAAQEQGREELRVALSTAGFTIENTSGEPRLGAVPAGLPKSADPYKLWKLAKLQVSVQPDAVVFRLTPQETDNSGRHASGFSHVALDVYIDVNRRPRAGRLRPLDGRPLRLFPENAWEYALEITPGKAALHSSAAGTLNPVYAARPRLVDGAVTVPVPRTVLKGNPLLWGYAALMLAPAARQAGGQQDFVIADSIAGGTANGYLYAVFPGRK